MMSEAARGQLLALVRKMWAAELAVAKPDLHVAPHVPPNVAKLTQEDTDDWDLPADYNPREFRRKFG